MHRRHAVYYAPPATGALARLGATWLGRDAETGARPAQPAIGNIAEVTSAPRRYGLHGTLKPPMRLADGCTADDLVAAVQALATTCAPVDLGQLRLKRLGGFLALVPEPQPAALEALAARTVRDLDHLRAAPHEAELARRRAAGLSPRQEGLLLRWGYPYLMEEFQFHVTLTGRLPADLSDTLMQAATDHFDEALSEPQCLADLAVFGEDDAGVFHLITRTPLTG